MAGVSRTSVSSRNSLIPQSFLADLYGDSLSEPTNGYIGESIANRTSQNYHLNEYGSSGENLTSIRARFDAAFPDTTRNTIILQGGTNNTANAAERTTLAQMKIDMGAMADAVIADGRYNLVIINHPPWMGHSEWTEALQTQTEDYNTWLDSVYGDYVADIYTGLGDPSEPRQFADWAYKTARTDVHPNRNADRVIDQLVADKLYQRADTGLTEPSGNLVANYRDFSGWSPSSATLGGNTVKLPDGTLGSANGMVPSLDANANHTFQANTSSSPTNNVPCEFVAYIQAGEQDFLWSQITDSNGLTYQMFFNTVTAELGAAGGTGGAGVWTIEKSTNGFVKIKLVYTNSATGASVNNIILRSADSIISMNTDPYNRTTDDYVPELFMDAVSLRVL